MATTGVTTSSTATNTATNTATSAGTTTSTATAAANKANAQKILTSLGAGSGVDVNSLAQNLVDAEKIPQQNAIQAKITKNTSRISGYSAVSYVVSNLQTALTALKDQSSFSSVTASSSATEFGAEPNTQVSFVDSAMPGMLPVLNKFCVEQAVRTGLGLNAKINLVSAFSDLGISKVRLTGGEPTIRKDFLDIGKAIHNFSNINSLVFTTNGYKLYKISDKLKNSGFTCVNISLDSLNSNKFYKIT